MPSTIVFDDQTTFLTDPVNPCSGQAFTLSWSEKNVGADDSAAYQDTVDLDDAGTGDSAAVRCDPLGAGQSVTRTVTFTLPSGDYTMTLVIDGKAPLPLGNVIVGDCL